MHDPALSLLMYVAFPLWVAAGFADWTCHRRTDIARTSGWKESALHLLMFTEIGVGMLVVALCEITTAVLGIVALVFVVHELTVYADLRYTVPLRPVGPFEQMVHSFLELLPLASLALLAVSAWDQPPDWSLHAKRQPWPAAYLWGAAVTAALINGLPYAQEMVSCLRARSKGNRRG
ncbi:diguanylate cyclase [Caenimonas aquaedulcis]|uniref:Diguanylate cyclase n=1 Tax=Caenimonas aquaedulcis TaxID=2793270 RepID=A0A931MG01_9BURK|nr:diguanylate cyclase [Caenimonas aquaedulcis]MBG9387602.1 diguanylate cyclase [Caenimonas aquaedulcis]